MSARERLTELFYLLMRDVVPSGEVAKLVKQVEDRFQRAEPGKTVFTAKGMENYARELATRVVGVEPAPDVDTLLDQLGQPTSPCAHVTFRPRCVSCFNRRLLDAEEKIRTALKGEPILGGEGHVTRAEVKGEYGHMQTATLTVRSGDKEYQYAVSPTLDMHSVLGRRVALVVLYEEPKKDAQLNLAERIADDLLKDATDRRGWRQEWDGFDKDVKAEIRKKWTDIVSSVLIADYLGGKR